MSLAPLTKVAIDCIFKGEKPGASRRETRRLANEGFVLTVRSFGILLRERRKSFMVHASRVPFERWMQCIRPIAEATHGTAHPTADAETTRNYQGS